MLAPARMPVAAGKKMAKTEKNVSFRKSGPMFSHMMEPERAKDSESREDGCVKRNESPSKERIGTNKDRQKECAGTVVAKVAHRLLVLEGDEGPNEVVDDGRDQDKQQEDLGLHGALSWLLNT